MTLRPFNLSLLFFCLAFFLSAWTHIEFGAGNYGADGLVDQETFDRKDAQYQVLYDEVDAQVKAHGAEGTIYLNDLKSDYADYAKAKVEAHCRKMGYTGVHVKTLVGDFTLIRFPMPQVDSAHLHNPEPALFAVANPEDFQRVANRSKTGLHITTYAWQEIDRLVNKGVEVKLTNAHAPAYRYPDGRTMEEIYPKDAVRHAEFLLVPKEPSHVLVPRAERVRDHFGIGALEAEAQAKIKKNIVPKPKGISLKNLSKITAPTSPDCQKSYFDLFDLLNQPKGNPNRN